MADFLTQMAQSSRERTERARARCPEAALREQAAASAPAPPLQLSDAGFDLIAELKLRSPALGVLGAAGEVEVAINARVQAYAAGGAAMVSVLTEPTRFDGALSHLEQATAALAGRIPVMRKDFLVDPYQVYEARAAGAGGVLLILRMLDDDALAALLESCIEMHLFALLEAFDEADLARAQLLVERYRHDATLLVGVNCRDLETLRVRSRATRRAGAAAAGRRAASSRERHRERRRCRALRACWLRSRAGRRSAHEVRGTGANGPGAAGGRPRCRRAARGLEGGAERMSLAASIPTSKPTQSALWVKICGVTDGGGSRGGTRGACRCHWLCICALGAPSCIRRKLQPWPAQLAGAAMWLQ